MLGSGFGASGSPRTPVPDARRWSCAEPQNLRHHTGVGWGWGDTYSFLLCSSAWRTSFPVPSCWFLWCVCPVACCFSSKEKSPNASLMCLSTRQDSKLGAFYSSLSASLHLGRSATITSRWKPWIRDRSYQNVAWIPNLLEAWLLLLFCPLPKIN